LSLQDGPPYRGGKDLETQGDLYPTKKQGIEATQRSFFWFRIVLKQDYLPYN
jgi:hypothetical protein